MNIAIWVKGLIAAIIGGVSNTIVLMIADPLNFNLGEGIDKLVTVAATSAIVAAAMYLKQSPIPTEVE